MSREGAQQVAGPPSGPPLGAYPPARRPSGVLKGCLAAVAIVGLLGVLCLIGLVVLGLMIVPVNFVLPVLTYGVAAVVTVPWAAAVMSAAYLQAIGEAREARGRLP